MLLVGREDATGEQETQHGTRFAVCDFLEHELGVRWLWPGDSGEVIPHQPTIVIGPLDRTDAPALLQRKLRDELALSSMKKDGKVRVAFNLDPARHEQLKAEAEDWLWHQRCGHSISLNYHHGFVDWHELYAKTHPDFFAMQLNGSRAYASALGGSERRKICVSNPKVLDQWTTNAKAWFAGEPLSCSFSASPNDNAFGGHCMCPACKAWDAADAPKVELTSVDANGRRINFPYPALTDRYVHFYNLAAERLAQIAPGKWVGGYAYGAWRTPPVHEKVRDNVIIGFVGFNVPMLDEGDLPLWDEWTKCASHFFLRPNLLHYGHGYPLLYPHWLADVIRHCTDTGMIGCDFDSIEHHWATQGLNYYVLARVLWNPHADVDAIITDYCAKGFGPAAPAMRAYFDALEQHQRDLSKIITTKSRDFPEASLPLHTPQQFDVWQTHLTRARELARNDSEVLRRIKFIAIGLEYARIHSTVTRLYAEAQTTGKSSPALAAAFAARNKFYHEQLNQLAIGISSIGWRELGRKNYGFDVAPPPKKRKND